MNTKSLVREELIPFLDFYPNLDLTNNLDSLKKSFNEQYASAEKIDVPGVSFLAKKIENPVDGFEIRILIYQSLKEGDNKPAILHTHGGGYVLGTPDMNDARNKILAKELDAVVVSVDYRLAPDAQYPLPQEDSYTALKWLWKNAGMLKVDPNRIGILGESAGGGMSAAVALMARDRKEIPLKHQFLIYPMLDDRATLEKDEYPYSGEFVWTRKNNYNGWKHMLGMEPGSEEVPYHAAAGRVEDVAGLAPAWIGVGDLDLFLSEDMAFAKKLMQGGIPTELHVFPGCYHGFDTLPDTSIGKRLEEILLNAMKEAL